MMDEYQSLLTRHQALQAQSSRNPQAVNVDVVRLLIADLYAAGRTISDPEIRDGLNEILQYWAEFVRERTGDRVENTIAPYTYHLGDDVKEPRSRFSLWLMVGGGVLGIIVIAVLVASTLVRNLRDEVAATEPVIPTEEVAEVLETPNALPVGPTPELVGTVTPVLLPSPTLEGPAATLTLPAANPTTALPTPTVAAVPSDPAGDVVSLGGGQAIASPPQGVDIAGCNISADTLVQASLPAPLNLEGSTAPSAPATSIPSWGRRWARASSSIPTAPSTPTSSSGTRHRGIGPTTPGCRPRPRWRSTRAAPPWPSPSPCRRSGMRWRTSPARPWPQGGSRGARV